MKMESQSDQIKSEISRLKNVQKAELALLKNQFHTTFEKLKPINLLKETFKEVSDSPDLKSNLLNSAIGLSTGFISKKLMIGNTSNPIKKVLGTVVEFAIANAVTKNSEKIISVGETLFQLIFRRKKEEIRDLQMVENKRLIDN
jgi:hypothetical protein